jgi:hypothetical protein
LIRRGGTRNARASAFWLRSIRRVRGRGAEAPLTGDSDPGTALARIVAGELRRIAATRTCA